MIPRLPTLNLPRRVLRWVGTAVAAVLMVTGMVRPTQNAIANGDTRTLSMYHTHTRETMDITFKRDGVYDQEALKKLNWFLRDWRRDEPVRMDPRLFDIVWAAYREVGGSGPIHIVCGYRAPETNAMLRRRSRGVAKFSQHTLGKAMDFFIPGVPTSAIRIAGLRLQRGGVGFYPTANTPFVHLDAGSIRMWPKMTRDQLAQVFPDGKTVHIPADGRKMPGYAEAYAEVMRNGAAVGGFQGVEENDSGGTVVASNQIVPTADETVDAESAASGGKSTDTPLSMLLAAQKPKTARPIPSETVMVASRDTTTDGSAVSSDAASPVAAAPQAPAAEPVETADVPMPAAKPEELTVASAGPAMVWQAGPQGVDVAVPLPPSRPGSELAQDDATDVPVEPEAPLVMKPTLLAESDAAPVVRPGAAIAANAAVDPIGALLPDARPTRQPAALAFAAADAPALRPAKPSPRRETVQMIATRFEHLDFGSVSRPVLSARDNKQAGLLMPDLTSIDRMIVQPERIVMIQFGIAAYQDLRSDSFSGPAIKPLRVAEYPLSPVRYTGTIAKLN